ARLSLSHIALGHTMDDQAETILYRLGRYGGLRSLRAMVPTDGLLVRPLLCLRRVHTERYCRLEGLPFAVDRGNEYPGYARTGIRQRVLPAWEEAVPGAVEAVTRAAEVAGEVIEMLDTFVDAAEADCRRGRGLWSIARLLGLKPRMRRLVFHALLLARPGIEVSRAHVEALEELIHRPGCAEEGLGGGWKAIKTYDVLCFDLSGAPDVTEGVGEGAEPEQARLMVPGEVRWREAIVRAESGVDFYAPNGPWEAYVDERRVGDELCVRGWLPGDRVHPLGAAGSRKLQDVFADLRVPVWLRRQVPILVRGDSIVWVAGLVVAEDARIVRDTRAIVRLSVETDPGDR
ncbi:MAG: tRNA lysidine(34) synthetase TilS, partial [Actinobacteria bacterium]|nr:tRNA lysidine(34) synthetase TilS [Actinomycetota bacterium]